MGQIYSVFVLFFKIIFQRKRPAEEKTGLEALSVAMLKNKCRELGLKVSGNKVIYLCNQALDLTA
jgi:hypothetical protein